MNFDEELKKINEENKLNKINNILIENKYLNILSKYKINVENFVNLNSLIFAIEQILNDYDLTDDEYDELNLVCEKLAEKNYYLYTNK